MESTMQLTALNTEVCQLVCQAGEKIMRFYQSEGAVTWKKDASPLTAADAASHDYLMESLQSMIPDAPIISEESNEANRNIGITQDRFWLVDPLDGTKEFVKRTNEFTVNVALIENGQPVLGVVRTPALNITYSGLRNSGAWRKEGDKSPAPISTRKATSLGLSVVASKDHAGPLVTAMLMRLPGASLQSMGSSLKFCVVAEGKADVYLRDLPTMEWDTAAAHCVVEAAGGNVYSLDGKPLRYGKAGLRNAAIITVGDTELDWTALIE
jgi:3'(2'), 5'-bisphosphate nucleotidase